MAVYRLARGVRARTEAFGLLFYNSRDTNLTFVRSGELLRLARLSSSDWSLTPNDEGESTSRKVQQFLDTLIRKGLIVETDAAV